MCKDIETNNLGNGVTSLGRGATVPCMTVILDVDNFEIVLNKELDNIVKLINKTFPADDRSFNGIDGLVDLTNVNLAKIMLTIAYWMTSEDVDKVKKVLEKVDISVVSMDSKLKDLILAVIVATGFELPEGYLAEEDTMINLFKLIVLNNLSPYRLPLELAEFKLLRNFIKKYIRVKRGKAEQISGYDMTAINARAALIQEIVKFDKFFGMITLDESGAFEIISKFRIYKFTIEDNGEQAKQINVVKSIIRKISKMRVEIYQDKNDKCIYFKDNLKTGSNVYRINIESYRKNIS